MTTAVFRDRDFYAVDDGALARLKAAAQASPTKRSRICLHASQDETIQQMLIAIVRGYPVGPLRQSRGHKTYCAVEGTLLVRFYFEDGSLDKEIRLTREASGTTAITFPAAAWQSCAAETDVAIYLEIQPGPFDPSQTERRAPQE